MGLVNILTAFELKGGAGTVEHLSDLDFFSICSGVNKLVVFVDFLGDVFNLCLIKIFDAGGVQYHIFC